MKIRRISAASAVTLLLLVAACGGDDDDTSAATQSVETPVGDVEVDENDIDTDALAEADSIEDVLDATGLETKASALQVAMDFDEYEMVDEQTVKIFLDGSAESDSIIDCSVARGVTDDDETVIAVYDDGEVNCRD